MIRSIAILITICVIVTSAQPPVEESNLESGPSTVLAIDRHKASAMYGACFMPMNIQDNKERRDEQETYSGKCSRSFIVQGNYSHCIQEETTINQVSDPAQSAVLSNNQGLNSLNRDRYSNFESQNYRHSEQVPTSAINIPSFIPDTNIINAGYISIVVLVEPADEFNPFERNSFGEQNFMCRENNMSCLCTSEQERCTCIRQVLLFHSHALVNVQHETWQNYLLQLLEVVNLLFAPTITEDEIGYLSVLISEHYHKFVSLHSSSMTITKHRYTVHMPQLILEFGPIVRFWTMRYEAKHNHLKQLAQNVGNFINVAWTLANHLQYWQCYQWSNDAILADYIDVGPGDQVTADDQPLELYDAPKCYRTSWIKICGTVYKPSCVVVLGVEDDYIILFMQK